MTTRDATCWVCDRPIGAPEELEVFPTSRIPFHMACLTPRAEGRDRTLQQDSTSDDAIDQS
jgi:hypothetical protein